MKKIGFLLIFLIHFNIFSDNNPLSNASLQNSVQPNSFADIVEPLIPTVVNIYTEQHIKIPKNNFPFNEFLFREFEMPFFFDDIYSNPKATALGSGFIIDKDGYIVTNNHVVENADKISVKLHDGTELEAKLIGADKKTDLALLKVEAKTDLPFAIFGDDQQTRVGDWIIAIGNPFGFNHTVTKGIVSSKARDIDLESEGIVNNYVQTDAPINRGNSGGPMFNLKGEVIGVNAQIYSTSGLNQGIGFAIPSHTVKKVVYQLKKFGKVNRGLLSIVIQSLTPEMAEGFDLKDQKGVLVTEVNLGGPGDKAGLKPGDIIIELNGKTVSSTRELQVLVAEAEINSTAKILVLRNGKPKELAAVIALDSLERGSHERQNNEPLGCSVPKGLSKSEIGLNDAFFANLSDVNIEKYNIDPKLKGVVVTYVGKSSSWRSYIKVGDVIVSVNQQDVTSTKELDKIYNEAKGIGKDKKKNIIFMIKRRNMNVFLALPFE
jgi:serine protease Do